jgi:hypothetical protein
MGIRKFKLKLADVLAAHFVPCPPVARPQFEVFFSVLLVEVKGGVVLSRLTPAVVVRVVTSPPSPARVLVETVEEFGYISISLDIYILLVLVYVAAAGAAGASGEPGAFPCC